MNQSGSLLPGTSVTQVGSRSFTNGFDSTLLWELSNSSIPTFGRSPNALERFLFQPSAFGPYSFSPPDAAAEAEEAVPHRAMGLPRLSS